MTGCELCGRKEAEVRAVVEGSTLAVCSNCSRYGRVIGRLSALAPAQPKPQRQPAAKQPEAPETVVPEYADIIKRKRESMGMKHDEFAKMLGERESLIAHIERGDTVPGIDLARKMEKILRVQLVGKAEESYSTLKRRQDAMTIGDLVRKK